VWGQQIIVKDLVEETKNVINVEKLATFLVIVLTSRRNKAVVVVVEEAEVAVVEEVEVVVICAKQARETAHQYIIYITLL
jgi:hypothetical protein